ncbi:MAG: hypothetical protein COV59_05090 [Candidatus Magasanikbacteria bacterium CG11_big_fil_rev_8_21_14_0_20_39_34]|uniref:Uncharacterized protein n=1 Tax=Candidatus Magasanikbacteria bacterium CG11_big_fil_rev_8_21_14_0_20_39_34 TaxID=1974653 RepID=A0A2H0N3T4_9BACT|nr:MAG: hypothetical protein COV59_05090 [Candidatus Magasanikbacteria bacterium CG11_big_fil_rev_8_21_14_0_20_39_34]
MQHWVLHIAAAIFLLTACGTRQQGHIFVPGPVEMFTCYGDGNQMRCAQWIEKDFDFRIMLARKFCEPGWRACKRVRTKRSNHPVHLKIFVEWPLRYMGEQEPTKTNVVIE